MKWDKTVKSKHIKWLVGGSIIVIALAILLTLGIGDGLVYYYLPKEAYEKGAQLYNKNVRVAGMVMAGTKSWKSDSLDLAFTLTDFKGHDYKVHYKGSPPDLFKENQGVIVEGYVDNKDKTIKGKKVLVKHSKEYRVPKYESIDKQLLEKSIFKEY